MSPDTTVQSDAPVSCYYRIEHVRAQQFHVSSDYGYFILTSVSLEQ